MSKRTIWRYVIPIHDRAIKINLDENAKILHVDTKLFHVSAAVTFWAEVNPEPERTVARYFGVFPTGSLIPNGATHVGTCLGAGGDLVWHLYELTGEVEL